MKLLFTIFGIPVYFFGLMVALGMLAGILAARLEIRRKGLDTEKFYDIVLYSVIIGVVGARLFYIAINDVSYYLQNPMKIIMINEGGSSIFGGILGAAIFAFLYSRKQKINFLEYADALAPGIILGQAVGRVGCDIFGKGMAQPMPWGISRQGQILHPAQVYEFLLDYLVFYIIWRKRKSVRYNGQLFLWYIVLFFINRGIIEFFRVNPSGTGWFSIAHLFSLIFIAGALAVMAVLKRKKPFAGEDGIKSEGHQKWEWLKDLCIVLALVTVSVFIYYTVQG